MKVYIIGIGMGTAATMTEEAKNALQKCDIVIGAERMLEQIEKTEKFISYKAEEIKKYLLKNKCENTAVLLSGDIGFFSAAKSILDKIDFCETELICGISTPVYFASKLSMPWEDMKLISCHGRNVNIIGHIKRSKKVFALLSGESELKEICRKLLLYGMEYVTLHIGERLSYSDERIISGNAEIILKENFKTLLCAVFENSRPENKSLSSIADEYFIRDKVPMTKREVRSLSINMSEITENSVIYDIGSGTGSVSVEMALRAIDGKVYAIEKNEAAAKLIEKNKIKFAADNIEIINGTAPEAFADLPKPTHAFIGGSGGNMREIILKLNEKAPDIKITINAAALETISEVNDIIGEMGINSNICCINVSRNKKLNGYTMMDGLNPVYIFHFTLNDRRL